MDDFVSESPCQIATVERFRRTHQLETLNSFYIKRRGKKYLHSLYAMHIDVDGPQEPFPLSSIDILERWTELGFQEPPSEIIRTSQGRFHVVIRIKPVRAFPEKVSYWQKCAKGLYKAFEDMGADHAATTNPVGLVRIPGHPNFKYPDKPIVETVYQSGSITTLTDIHQTLIDAQIIRPPAKRQNDVAENIAILEAGVPEGVRNPACYTLALHYKGQGIPEQEALTRLLFWNDSLRVPNYPSQVNSCVKSAYGKDKGLSRTYLSRIAAKARDWQSSKPVPVIERVPKPPRDKIRGYAYKIRRILESSGGFMVTSKRGLAKDLNIPFSSFNHALELIPGLTLKSYGTGRAAVTEIRLDKPRPKLRVVVSNPDLYRTEINDPNK